MKRVLFLLLLACLLLPSAVLASPEEVGGQIPPVQEEAPLFYIIMGLFFAYIFGWWLQGEETGHILEWYQVVPIALALISFASLWPDEGKYHFEPLGCIIMSISFLVFYCIIFMLRSNFLENVVQGKRDALNRQLL